MLTITSTGAVKESTKKKYIYIKREREREREKKKRKKNTKITKILNHFGSRLGPIQFALAMPYIVIQQCSTAWVDKSTKLEQTRRHGDGRD